jgi:glyoxylase-like metal-dependent hydrolase (beta-lactamase superfamily II)
MSVLVPGVHLVDGVALAGRPGVVNVSLLVGEGEATLVDAGFPGVTERLVPVLAEAGIAPSDVKRVIITHHHGDHTGGLAEVVRLTGAEVWAHEDDAGYIDGSVPRPGPSPALLEIMRAQGRAPSAGPEPVAVARRLTGDEDLDIFGGVKVLHTPGHTPGHIALLVARLAFLLAGDALRVEEGRVVRPPEMFAWDLELSERSIRELSLLEFDAMLPYHGEFLAHGASDALRADLGLEPGLG